MKRRTNVLIGVIAAFIIVAGGGALTWHVQAAHHTAATVSQHAPTSLSYRGITGKTALQVLQAAHQVQTKIYSGFGPLVTAIDGQIADAKHFWAFYVNGKLAQVGAGSYQTKSTDTVTWKLEAE
ncbi:MAG TPA: DUF4430 domain-containing protein [Candidatus Saccharimonadales bacterium]|jgi:hypothetical protein|nr:DUF4430 domain-containing protein [Candidatus Saccharimonadales bacterium]